MAPRPILIFTYTGHAALPIRPSCEKYGKHYGKRDEQSSPDVICGKHEKPTQGWVALICKLELGELLCITRTTWRRDQLLGSLVLPLLFAGVGSERVRFSDVSCSSQCDKDAPYARRQRRCHYAVPAAAAEVASAGGVILAALVSSEGSATLFLSWMRLAWSRIPDANTLACSLISVSVFVIAATSALLVASCIEKDSS